MKTYHIHAMDVGRVSEWRKVTSQKPGGYAAEQYDPRPADEAAAAADPETGEITPPS